MTAESRLEYSHPSAVLTVLREGRVRLLAVPQVIMSSLLMSETLESILCLYYPVEDIRLFLEARHCDQPPILLKALELRHVRVDPTLDKTMRVFDGSQPRC